MEERRGARRFQVRLPARWELASAVHSGVVINVSRGGCFVQTQTEEPDDAPMRLEIQLSDGEWVSLRGEVAYYLPTEGFGLQFIEGAGCENPVFERWLERQYSPQEGRVEFEGADGAPRDRPAGLVAGH